MLTKLYVLTMGRLTYERLPFGSENIPRLTGAVICPGCGRRRDELHRRFCYVEKCPRCTGQFYSCGCFPEWKASWFDWVCVH